MCYYKFSLLMHYVASDRSFHISELLLVSQSSSANQDTIKILSSFVVVLVLEIIPCSSHRAKFPWDPGMATVGV